MTLQGLWLAEVILLEYIYKLDLNQEREAQVR